jgi:spermidine/putrescine transport system substrate-binding protein
MWNAPHQMMKLFRNLGNLLKSGKLTSLGLISGTAICMLGLVTSCTPSRPTLLPTPSLQPPSKEIVFCDYADDLPTTVLDGFTAETGIQIHYQAYDGMDEAVQMVKTKTNCDVIAIGNDFILELSQAGLLAKLNKTNIPNIKNLSPNFREMAYDPKNSYSVPYNWGTSGLLFRSDLIQVTGWKDLWNPKFKGKIGLWRGEPRDEIGLALKSLGFSANSEKPSEVNAAVDRLIELGSRVLFLDDENQAFATDYLKEGKIVMALGWAADAIQSQEANPAIRYILPDEGAMLWGDNFVIPATSPHQEIAEKYLNYILRPEISAQIANLNSYATANQAALALIKPEILNNPVVFPSNEALKKAEIFMPLSPEGEKLYHEAWARFLNTHKKP